MKNWLLLGLAGLIAWQLGLGFIWLMSTGGVSTLNVVLYVVRMAALILGWAAVWAGTALFRRLLQRSFPSPGHEVFVGSMPSPVIMLTFLTVRFPNAASMDPLVLGVEAAATLAVVAVMYFAWRPSAIVLGSEGVRICVGTRVRRQVPWDAVLGVVEKPEEYKGGQVARQLGIDLKKVRWFRFRLGAPDWRAGLFWQDASDRIGAVAVPSTPDFTAAVHSFHPGR